MPTTYNKEIPRPNTPQEFTNWQVQELIKCRDDIFYWAEKYVKVKHPKLGVIKVNFKGRDYQKNFLRSYQDHRHTIVLAARQMGKCIFSSTMVDVRDKNTGKIFKVSLGELHLKYKNKHKNLSASYK
jgi:hypothetical protein